MKLIAARALTYGGRSFGPGEAFEASETHGKVLKAIRKATDAPAAAPEPPPAPPAAEPPRPPRYPTRRMTATTGTDAPATLPVPTPDPSAAPVYDRRDLQATED